MRLFSKRNPIKKLKRMKNNDDSDDNVNEENDDPNQKNEKSGKQKNDKDKRAKRRIVGSCHFKVLTDPTAYYLENCVLYMAWQNYEKEFENVDIKEVYEKNIEEIEKNRAKYFQLSQDQMDEIENALEDDNEDSEEFSIKKAEELDDLEIDLMNEYKSLDNKTNEEKKPKFSYKVQYPNRISDFDINEMMSLLNEEQRSIVMHIYKCFKTNTNLPFHIFISGSAGVGKSLVIRTIYQLLLHLFNKQIHGECHPDSVEILLCAPTGKAAHLIEGNTVHSAFKLPITKSKHIEVLSADITNTIRAELRHLKLIIIDEISMLGARVLNLIDQRLRQIFGIDKPFGDIPILFVGDLNQLPPVMDRPIYKAPNTSELSDLVTPELWNMFEIFSLNKIMRQKDDLAFINALNNIANGKTTKEDRELFNTRVVKRNQIDSVVPKSCIRLFATNKAVDDYNAKCIAEQEGQLYTSIAVDKITVNSKFDEEHIETELEKYKSKPKKETNGIMLSLPLKIGIRYMVIVNLNVSDGLCNGSTGILKHITFEEKSGEKVPKILWMDFKSEKIGKIARSKYIDFMKKNNIELNLTPIEKYTLIDRNDSRQIYRIQYPLNPAEGVTVHKIQGATEKEMCVDLSSGRPPSRNLLYVALSRVTSLDGLYIINKMPELNPIIRNEAVHIVDYMKNTKSVKLCYDTTHRGDTT